MRITHWAAVETSASAGAASRSSRRPPTMSRVVPPITIAPSRSQVVPHEVQSIVPDEDILCLEELDQLREETEAPAVVPRKYEWLSFRILCLCCRRSVTVLNRPGSIR